MWHLCFIVFTIRIALAFGSVCRARRMSQNVEFSYKDEAFDHAAGLLSLDLQQLPESLLQLTSQRRKPWNGAVAALSQGGELLKVQKFNNSVSNVTRIGVVPYPGVQRGKRLSQRRDLLSHRVARGVSATGELIQTGEMAASINLAEAKDGVKAEHTSLMSNVQDEAVRQKLSPWLVLSLLQNRSSKDGLAEGLLIFILVNVFMCAVGSGMYFLYSARKGAVYEGMHDDSSEEEPAVRVPRGDHGHHQSHRQTQEINIPSSARPPKPVSAGSWSPSFASAPHTSEAHHHPPNVSSRQSERQSEAPTSAQRHLCPELVVPRGSECVLAVRTLVSARLQQVEFDILDVNGKPVLQVEVSPQFASHSRPWPVQLQRSPTIALKALNPRESTGAFILCYCCNVTKDESSGSKRNVYIYRDDHELFAHLMKDEIRGRYVLTSGRLGLQLLFEGNFEEHAVDVTNESRELLAATEPGIMDFDPINKYYKLRVAADVDVGLVLCGLLAIDQMEVP